MSDIDKRSVTGWVHAIDKSETRSPDGSDKVLRVAGYAALFNTPSEQMGKLVETIDPRAFDDVLATNPDVRFQAEHSGLALARTTNGTLRITTDDRGLYFEADLNPMVQAARDLYALVERGDITQMSFGFIIGTEQVKEDGGLLRAHVTRVDKLFELSAVAFPAYAETVVYAPQDGIDASDDYMPGDDDLDDELGDGGDDMWVVEVAIARRLREQNG